jgi:hypothetical protein
MLDGRDGGHRRGSPRYSYKACSSGVVDGQGMGLGFCNQGYRTNLMIQSQVQMACTLVRLNFVH